MNGHTCSKLFRMLHFLSTEPALRRMADHTAAACCCVVCHVGGHPPRHCGYTYCTLAPTFYSWGFLMKINVLSNVSFYILVFLGYDIPLQTSKKRNKKILSYMSGVVTESWNNHGWGLDYNKPILESCAETLCVPCPVAVCSSGCGGHSLSGMLQQHTQGQFKVIWSGLEH